MKSSVILAAAIAVIASVWIVSGFFSSKADGYAPAESHKEEALTDVRVRELTAESATADVTVTGQSKASRIVTLKAETDGQVAELLAEEGEPADEDQLIARLDTRDRAARVSEARELVKQRDIEFNAAKSLENKGYNSRIKLAQARADLEAAKAQLKNAEVELSNTEITAPFAGVLYEQHIEVGDFVSMGDPLFEIVDLDPIEFVGFIPEKKIMEIAQDAPASIVLLNGKKIEGSVSYIAPAADQQARTFRIEVSAPNPEMAIIDGLTVEIRIPVAEKMVHKISPSILALDDAGRVGVKIVNDRDTVEFRPVAILADTPDYMLIGGLPEKALVITVGQDFVVEGQKVNPVPAKGEGLL